MRTHTQIVKAVGASELAHQLRARGIAIALNTPQRWAERDSIPAQYWPDVVAIGAASLNELAIAAATKRSVA